MKNHFIISYAGNKREEVEHIYKAIAHILPNVDTIIEPYCGTSAMSFYIASKHPNQYKYILNDECIELIELYEIMKDDHKLNELIASLNSLHKKICLDESSYVKQKQLYNELKQSNNLIHFVYLRTIYSLRVGLFPTEDRLKIMLKQDYFNKKN